VSSPAQLKVELAMRGLKLDSSVRLKRDAVAGEAAVLDLRLPDRICVTAPIDDHRAAASPFRLIAEGDRHVLVRGNGEAGGLHVEVRPIDPPRFYARRTTSGTPMRRIGAVRGGHLIVSPSSACGFSVQGTPCRFCLEGARMRVDRDAASPAEVVEVVRAALDEGIAGSVYFNSGTFESDYGLFHLRQQGTALVGCYEHDGGLLEGSIDGRVMKLTWREDGGPGDQGPALMIVTPDGKAFRGFWWAGDAEQTANGAGTWDGKWQSAAVGSCPHWSVRNTSVLVCLGSPADGRIL